MTKRNQKIELIRKKALPVLKRYGVRRAGLFGSVARGRAAHKSDIDLLVEIMKPISLLGFVKFKHELEDVLGKSVDLVEFSAIKPHLQPYIMEDYIPLFESV